MAQRTRQQADLTSTETLPNLATASTELMRREVRAIVWMLVRLFGAGVLTALIMRSAPSLQSIRPIFDAASGILVLWPLFTSLGRTFAWRIALGTAYTKAERYEDAECTLVSITGIPARLFDAAGEGRFHRALSLVGLKRPDEAQLVFQEVVESGREPWKTRAAEELNRLSQGTQKGPAAPKTTST